MTRSFEYISYDDADQLTMTENTAAYEGTSGQPIAEDAGPEGPGLGAHAPDGRTEALAPVLWEIGRVREHMFLEVPPLGLRAPRLVRRVAPQHAFVIDVTPRTPQARRRLRLETA